MVPETTCSPPRENHSSSGSGLMTFGVKGLGGDLISAAVGSVPAVTRGVHDVIRQRRSLRVVTVRNKIIGVDS